MSVSLIALTILTDILSISSRTNNENIMKYTISLEYLYHTSVEVDADSFEDAVEKAISDPQIDSVSPNELEDATPTYAIREDGKERYDF